MAVSDRLLFIYQLSPRFIVLLFYDWLENVHAMQVCAGAIYFIILAELGFRARKVVRPSPSPGYRPSLI